MSAPVPTFLILGAPRAGTTALHHWLGQHPDVCVSRPKETEFLSLHHDEGLAFYRRFFRHHAGESVIGESTPMYLVLPGVPQRIARLLPDVVLIAVLRDPVQQAHSTWWMMRGLGVERRSFADAIAHELGAPERTEGEVEALWARLHQASARGRPVGESAYLLTGGYEAALRRYAEHTDPARMTVLLHDDLVSDATAVARTLAAAVGVDHARAATPEPPRTNESVGLVQARAQRASRLLPSSRARQLVSRAAGALERSDRPPIEPDTRRRLIAHFTAANAGLSKLIGRDVSHWFGDRSRGHG